MLVKIFTFRQFDKRTKCCWLVRLNTMIVEDAYSLLFFSLLWSLRLIEHILSVGWIVLFPRDKEALPAFLIFVINKYLLFSIHSRHDSAPSTTSQIWKMDCKTSWGVMSQWLYPSVSGPMFTFSLEIQLCKTHRVQLLLFKKKKTGTTQTI